MKASDYVKGGRPLVTQQDLFDRFEYNPETGLFTYAVAPYKKAQLLGQVAGSLTNNGYISIMINKVHYLAHRLAWLYVYGDFPEMIDHINRDKSDNRIANLRICTTASNQHNTTHVVPGDTGVVGVAYNEKEKTYRCRIMGNGKRHCKQFLVSKYESKEAALLAATVWITEQRVKYHGEFLANV